MDTPEALIFSWKQKSRVQYTQSSYQSTNTSQVSQSQHKSHSSKSSNVSQVLAEFIENKNTLPICKEESNESSSLCSIDASNQLRPSESLLTLMLRNKESNMHQADAFKEITLKIYILEGRQYIIHWIDVEISVSCLIQQIVDQWEQLIQFIERPSENLYGYQLYRCKQFSYLPDFKRQLEGEMKIYEILSDSYEFALVYNHDQSIQRVNSINIVRELSTEFMELLPVWIGTQEIWKIQMAKPKWTLRKFIKKFRVQNPEYFKFWPKYYEFYLIESEFSLQEVILDKNILIETIKDNPMIWMRPRLFLDQLFKMAGTIRILTLNMFLRPPPIHSNSTDWKSLRAQYLIDHVIEKYDIIFLQEIFGLLNFRKMRIIEGAYNKGFKYYAESPSPSFWNLYLMDGGLLVLSRFPIAKINFRSFEVGCFPDDLCDKGVLHTQINIEGSLVNFFTTHSQSSYPTQSYEKYMQYRKLRYQQFQVMRKMYEEVIPQNSTCIILGDLNFNSRETPEQVPHRGNWVSEYEEVINLLQGNQSIFDVIKHKYNEFPATFGCLDCNNNPIECVLTVPEEVGLQSCLDYVLILGYENRNFEINWDQTHVDHLFTPGQPFTQLSDHCGINLSIILKSY